ncbi:hypothetical protein Tco_0364541 [Tanacetum coccineum]
MGDHFFWVDYPSVPISVPCILGACWRRRSGSPTNCSSITSSQVLSSNKAPFRRYPECFLALVGLSPYYPFGENTYPAFEGPDRTDMGLLDYITTADPRKYKPAHQASGSGSGAGAEVSAEGNVVEENVIPEGAFLNPTDPECDETESRGGPVVLRDQFLVFVAADKSLLSTEVSALKNVVSQKDTDISLLDSRASYLKSALDDSQAACEMDLHRVSTLHSAFSDFKEKMEAQQEEQAQELYNRVAELEAHVMDVSGLLEEEFYPAYLTTLAGRRPCRGLYGNARSCPYLATVPRATLRPHRNNADEMLLPGDFFVLCSSLTFMGVTRA